MNLDSSIDWLYALGSTVKSILRQRSATRYIEIEREDAISATGSNAFVIGWAKSNPNTFAGLWADLAPYTRTLYISYGFESPTQKAVKELAAAGDTIFPKASIIRLQTDKAPTLMDCPVLELRPRGKSFYGMYLGSTMSDTRPAHPILALDIAQFIGRVLQTLRTGKSAGEYDYEGVADAMTIQPPCAHHAQTYVPCPACKKSLAPWESLCSVCNRRLSGPRSQEKSIYEFDPGDT